jgi:hypothetical protein
MRGLTRTTFLAAAAAVLAATAPGAGTAHAQFGRNRNIEPSDAAIRNTPYDGRFTFARIRFTPFGGGGGGGWFGGDMKWHHDYPDAETHFMKILRELSTLRPYMDGGNVFRLDDPELFKYPLAYLCEPGFWIPTDAEAAALRAYLAKGGFIIFDDFFGPQHWAVFEAAIRKALPQARLVRLDTRHAIFDSFFRIDDPTARQGGFRGGPEFWGIYEDNDPAKRLIAIANFNNDIGENWEWSDTGAFPVDMTSTAYKLGVNYLVYAMTH